MSKNIKSILASVLFVAGIVLVSLSGQSQFCMILFGFSLSFLTYSVFITKQSLSPGHLSLLIGLGIAIRFYLIFVFPSLSDDVYRFYWDGLMSQSGLNPYGMIPSQVMDVNPSLDRFTEELYLLLNSKQYYTIYPPFSQIIFYLASYVPSVFAFSVILKSIFLVFDLLCLRWLMASLSKLNINSANALIYFLNPLVIIEGVGNLHFELIMVSFLGLFIYALISQRKLNAYFAYGLAIATKLTPLLLGPLVLYYLNQKKHILRFLVIGFLTIAVLFLPIILGFNFFNLADSIDLYFRKFEFNASIYYVLREIGFFFSGYNLIAYIGPSLAIITVLFIVKLSRRVEADSVQSLISYSLLSYLIYLLFATTVHPWYLIPLIFFTAFKPSKLVLIWSFLIVLSYFSYSVGGWKESPLLLCIEYVPIYLMLYFGLGSTDNKLI